MYSAHPHHRNAQFATKKSQWTISVAEETSCYARSVANDWKCRKSYLWGICFVEGPPMSISKLGISPLPSSSSLYIAKFVSDDQLQWHGYPVAHWLSPYDKPPETVLAKWRDAGYINTPKMSRILRGKPCTL